MKITLFIGKTSKIKQGLNFQIDVKNSSRAKRLTLRIDTKKRIPILTVPTLCSATKAISFANEHKKWINEQIQKIPQKIIFCNNFSFALFDKVLTITHNKSVKNTYVDQTNLFVGGDIEFLHRRVKDFIKKTAKQELTLRTKQKARLLGCNVKIISIKDTKSRWGSCSSLGNINYNWRTALMPDFVVDYLISHEVAHLVHQNHSQDFWSCVASLCPKHTEARKWLKNNATKLNCFE